jgi:Spy/CpxP family protein refolding chaperone
MNAFCPRNVLRAALMPATLSLASLVQAAPAVDATPSSLDDHVELSGRSLSERARQPALRDASSGSHYTVTQSAAEPLATANQSAGAAGWYGRAPHATQMMVWAKPLSGSGLRLGVGVEQRGAAFGGGLYATPYQNLRPGAAGDAGVLVGLAMPTGPRSHAFVQTPLLDAQRAQIDDLNVPGLNNRDQRQVRVGLAFTSRKAYADLRKGFKMELSGQSSLTFRPRGGRVGVTFQKIW